MLLYHFRCDRANDCNDRSDETDCKTIIVEDSYQSHAPPPPLDTTAANKSVITVGVNIVNILDVSEVNSFVKVQFQLEVVWRDPRVSFWNLKEGNRINILSKEEGHELWLPEIVFLNTEDLEGTEVSNCNIWK